MDATFVQKILEVGTPIQFDIDGRVYASKPLHLISKPMPASFNLLTLTGIVDLIEKNIEGAKALGKNLVVHVEGAAAVWVYGEIQDDTAARRIFAHAVWEASPQFGQWLDLESFNVFIQTAFVQDDQTAHILRVVGNVTEAKATQYNDDGVTQAVTVKAGISLVEKVALPNPVSLRPWRTFREVQQPASFFVLRMRSGGPSVVPACALFKADGDMWILDAVHNVKKWLAERLPETTILA